MKWLKRFIWLFWACLIITITLCVCLDWSKGKMDNQDAKQVEIKQSVISGYDGQLRRFWIKAQTVWTAKSPYIFYAEDISNGILFDELGKKVVDGISAKKVKVNSKTHTFSAENGVMATLYGVNDRQEPIVISCDQLRYYELNGRAYMQGNIVLKQGEMEIRPQGKVEFDRFTNVVTIEEGLMCHFPPFTLSATMMTLFLNDNKAVVSGNIQGTRHPEVAKDLDERQAQLLSVPTSFSCRQLVYEASGNRQVVDLYTDVVISQKKRYLYGQHGHYNQQNGDFTMMGKAVFKSDSLTFLVDNKRKKAISHPDVVKGIGQPTTVTCQSFQFNTRTKTLVLYGNIILTQPHLALKSNQITYSDVDGTLDLSGYVDIRKGQKLTESVKTSQLTYNLYKENMKMKGNIDTIIELKKKSL